jgi:hypothetical protein
MGLAEHFKQNYDELEKAILTAVKNQVGNRKLDFKRSIIVAEHGDENECIISINEALMVDTELVHNVAEEVAHLSDYPLHIQIAILDRLEQGAYNIAEEEEIEGE